VNKELTPVLVLTYYFPPAGGPGVQRILKFIRYLPEFGWRPVVMTVAGGDFPARDASLEKDIPEDTPIIRVPAVEPYAYYRKFTGKNSNESIPVGTLSTDENNSLSERMARWIRANLFIPDARMGWIFPVIKRASSLIHRYDIKAIMSSSPPQSVQVAAQRMAQHHSLPWIADFRDPWTDIYYYQGLNRLKLANVVDAWLEQKVLRNADAVITVSNSIAAQFEKKARTHKTAVIPNGYDSNDFVDNVQHTYEKFSISYIGNLKANQNPEVLWNALNQLTATNSQFAKDFKLEITGKIHPEVITKLEEFDLKPFLKIQDYVPHYEATRRMRQAAVLLFIIPEAPNNQGILTGKLFEYLAAGRPILSIGPVDGDAAEILRDTGAGEMFAPSDMNGIQLHIEKLYKSWQTKKMKEFTPKRRKVERYERRQLTSELSDLLNRVSHTREYAD